MGNSAANRFSLSLPARVTGSLGMGRGVKATPAAFGSPRLQCCPSQGDSGAVQTPTRGSRRSSTQHCVKARPATPGSPVLQCLAEGAGNPEQPQLRAVQVAKVHCSAVCRGSLWHSPGAAGTLFPSQPSCCPLPPAHRKAEIPLSTSLYGLRNPGLCHRPLELLLVLWLLPNPV